MAFHRCGGRATRVDSTRPGAGISQGNGAVEHRPVGPVVVAVGDKIALPLKLEVALGRHLRGIGLQHRLHRSEERRVGKERGARWPWYDARRIKEVTGAHVM